MIYGYARVSTKGQAKDGNSLEAQKEKLLENGVKEKNIFTDSFTGTKVDRPQFTKLLEKLKKGDTLVVTKLDRFARSAIDGSKLVGDLLDKGIKVHVLNMGLMDNTPNGKLIRTIFFAFADFERDMIVERTKEGKAIAKATNPNFKEGRPKTPADKRRTVIELSENSNMTIGEIVKSTGLSRSTVIRIRNEHRNEDVLNTKCNENEN